VLAASAAHATPRCSRHAAFVPQIELHQFGRGERGGKAPVGDVIPTRAENTGGIAEAALHFIGQRNRRNKFAPVAPTFRRRERRRDVSWMRRLFRKISVVVIK